MPAITDLTCHWIGPLSDQEGFAEEGRGLVSALRAARVAVTEHDIPHPRTFQNIPLMQEIPASIDYRESDPCIYHRYWAAPSVATKGAHIWRTMFETNGIPIEWVRSSSDYDALWVPSEFNRRTYLESGVPEQKITVIPCPLPTWTTLLTSNIQRVFDRDPSTFTFLSVLRWHRRKGWDILVNAFINEFLHEPGVKLVIKARSFDPRKPEQPGRELAQFLAERHIEVPPNIIVITQDFSINDLAKLYGNSDAFVLASRGEGWGRPLLEAMLSGLPTIGPRWGGNLNFMNDSNSILVDGELTPVDSQSADEWPYFSGQTWFQPDTEELQLAMRRVVDMPRIPVSRATKTAKSLITSFSTEKIGAQMKSALARFA